MKTPGGSLLGRFVDRNVTPERMELECSGSVVEQRVSLSRSKTHGAGEGGKNRAVDFAFYRARFKTRQARGRHGHLDVARTSHQLIHPGTGIAQVVDSAAARMYVDDRPGDVLQGDIPAGGGHFNVTISHLSQRNGATQGFYVDVGVADQVRIHRGSRTFENQITLKVLCRERAC